MVCKKEYITNSAQQTQKLGEKLAKDVLKTLHKDRAVVLSLKGELGGGKTTFLQGFARGLNIKEKILSPTFVVLKRFEIKKEKRFKNFYHIDCYRLQERKDILELGFKEIISNPKNIVAIEWPERIKEATPKGKILIEFDFLDKDTRKILINF